MNWIWTGKQKPEVENVKQDYKNGNQANADAFFIYIVYNPLKHKYDSYNPLKIDMTQIEYQGFTSSFKLFHSMKKVC